MSSFSANQYNNAFKPQRLQNWCTAKKFKERPSAHEGHTAFIANDRGHLLPGVVKRGSAWPDFKGTWDLPARIPTHPINPTARSVEGLNRLKSWGIDPQHAGKSQPQRGCKSADKDDGNKTSGDVQQGSAAPSFAVEVKPSLQSHPVTGGEVTARQNQEPQAAVTGSISQPTEDKQATEGAGKDRLLSQGPVAEEKPALRAAADEGTSAGTGAVRPGTYVSEKAASQRGQ